MESGCEKQELLVAANSRQENIHVFSAFHQKTGWGNSSFSCMLEVRYSCAPKVQRGRTKKLQFVMLHAVRTQGLQVITVPCSTVIV